MYSLAQRGLVESGQPGQGWLNVTYPSAFEEEASLVKWQQSLTLPDFLIRSASN